MKILLVIILLTCFIQAQEKETVKRDSVIIVIEDEINLKLQQQAYNNQVIAPGLMESMELMQTPTAPFIMLPEMLELTQTLLMMHLRRQMHTEMYLTRHYKGNHENTFNNNPLCLNKYLTS